MQLFAQALTATVASAIWQEPCAKCHMPYAKCQMAKNEFIFRLPFAEGAVLWVDSWIHSKKNNSSAFIFVKADELFSKQNQNITINFKTPKSYNPTFYSKEG